MRATSSTNHDQIAAGTRPRVLVVDDEELNIRLLSRILREDYQISQATDGAEALSIARQPPQPDLILLDRLMPVMDGEEVCRRLKSDPTTAAIPVIFVTASNGEADEARGFALGAVDYLTKPVRPAVVHARVRTHLALYNQTRHLASLVAEQTAELEDSCVQLTDRLGRASEFKDDDTGMHVIRMATYTKLLATSYGLSPKVVDVLHKAAPMHDVGKIGIPDEILLKPGRLTVEEMVAMQAHTTIGATILGESRHELLRVARQMALTHHERWDGGGYPAGLSGEAIPLAGRIGAVADVFDALTSARPYKEAWEVGRAVELIESEAGKHFDPEVVRCFQAVLPEILEIRQSGAVRV